MIAGNRRDNEFRGVDRSFTDMLDTLVQREKKQKGITQADIAKGIGISTGALSKYLNGLMFPKAEIINKIAKYFGVSTDYLLGVSEVESTKTSIKAACKTTGLSENSVKVLHDLSADCLDVINYILQYPYLTDVLLCLAYSAGVDNACKRLDEVAKETQNGKLTPMAKVILDTTAYREYKTENYDLSEKIDELKKFTVGEMSQSHKITRKTGAELAVSFCKRFQQQCPEVDVSSIIEGVSK